MTVTPADRGPQVSAVAGLFLALGTIGILLRCYCRVFVVKAFGLDDWFAVIAWLFFVIFCGLAITSVHYGTGQHASALPQEAIPVGLKWWWACESVYVLSNMALKLSISIFLLRIAVTRVSRIIIYSIITVVELYSAFYFFLFVLQCRPSSYFWTQYTDGTGTCVNPKLTVDATYAYSAVSCVADWALGLVPIFLIWNVQMDRRTKLSVAAILSVGAIASSATIIRIPYIQDLANVEDFLYATTDVAIWSTVETGIGIAASAAATLRPLFRTYFGTSRGAGGSSSNNWPRSGYVRNNGMGGEGYGLRSDLGKRTGVTTVIEGDSDDRGGTSSKGTFGDGRWNDSNSKLRGGVSDDESEWRDGIMKTTRTTQGV
ncbi:hypothetical protein V501_01900 [Pseudogymnoascus sp. VKM F-4519 (FW-2642)]|nr:hypothetical protein V501_01900 [Pseudogymnoascus sp. VKM F-4519 (FW-2642)]